MNHGSSRYGSEFFLCRLSADLLISAIRGKCVPVAAGLRREASILLTVVFLLSVNDVRANGQRFALLIGGGPEASESPVSLEENIIFAKETFRRLGVAIERQTVLFASGRGSQPDVCERRDPIDKPSDARGWLAEVFDSKPESSLRFRHHRLGNVASATRESIGESLARLAAELQAGDQLWIYLTGHGTAGQPSGNGAFETWGRDKFTVRMMGKALDQFNPEVQIFLIAVSCYAGTFADVLHEDGDPQAGLTTHRRAGFFATREYLPSAGCSPDAIERRQEESTTPFFTALSGYDRQGKQWLTANGLWLEQEGMSLAYAAAITKATLDSFDVPMTTSDHLLRRNVPYDRRDRRLLPPDRDFSRLIAVAESRDRALLEFLSRQLQLGGENRIATAIRHLDTIDYEIRSAAEEAEKQRAEARRCRQGIASFLTSRWPFLKNPWHPQSEQLCRDEPGEVIEAVTRHPLFPAWRAAHRAVESNRAKQSAEQTRLAKHQRLIQTAERVALSHNLSVSGNENLKTYYRRLTSMEEQAVRPSP